MSEVVLSSNKFLFEMPRDILEEITSLNFFLSRSFTHTYMCIKPHFPKTQKKFQTCFFNIFTLKNCPACTEVVRVAQ